MYSTFAMSVNLTSSFEFRYVSKYNNYHNSTTGRLFTRPPPPLPPTPMNDLTVPRRYFFCGSFLFFSDLCFLCLCAPLFICALWQPAGKGLTSWLLVVVPNCKFITFQLVSWVRCGTWLYWFLIFEPLLTLTIYEEAQFDFYRGWELRIQSSLH